MTAVTTAGPAPARKTSPARGNALAGTRTLLRFNLRRDRIRIPVWIGALSLGTVATAASYQDLYPSQADLDTVANTMDSPAGLAMTGPREFLSDYNLGALMGHQMLGFMVVLVAIMSILMVVRHTRTEEETGRAELVRAGVVGRHAHLTAALLLALIVNVALAVLLWVGLGGIGVDGITWEGSLLYGAAHAAVGIVFAAIAAVTVQITAHPRGAAGWAFGALGLAYFLRAAGDSADNAASWLSPIGWAQQTLVYVENHWWPLLLALALAAVATAVAYNLSTRRDVGAGLRAARTGSPEGSAALTSPRGFAMRLHRGLLIGFAAAMALFGMMYGSILGDVDEMFENIDAMQEAIADIGGVTFVESFLTMIMMVLALIASIYVVMATLRARSEETAGRAEPVLSTALSRSRWLWSHLAIALIGGTAILVFGALFLGATGAPAADDSSLFLKALAASLAYAPALWVTAGVAVALFGWFPRASALAWVVVVYGFIVGYLGQILQFPDGLTNLSPFGHVPGLPVEDFNAIPLLILTSLAAGLIALGIYGFNRRDLETK
jgi:ABC-2 type transport system permease protein